MTPIEEVLRVDVYHLKQAIEYQKKEIAYLRDLVSREEGHRLFKLCISKGAHPGNVYQWLKEKLSNDPDD